jgi:hypothetical protein
MVMMMPAGGFAGGALMQHPQMMQSAIPMPGMLGPTGQVGVMAAFPGAATLASAAAFPATVAQTAQQEQRLQPQTIAQEVGRDGRLRIKWTVDSRKLKANDKAVISPSFEIHSIAGTFRMIINPSTTKFRGGTTFKNSNGRGNVQLKCETDSASSIRFRISIGDGRPGGKHVPSRGDVQHNFAHGGVCGLPKHQEEWDFNRVVDEASKTFVVCVEILA